MSAAGRLLPAPGATGGGKGEQEAPASASQLPLTSSPWGVNWYPRVERAPCNAGGLQDCPGACPCPPPPFPTKPWLTGRVWSIRIEAWELLVSPRLWENGEGGRGGRAPAGCWLPQDGRLRSVLNPASPHAGKTGKRKLQAGSLWNLRAPYKSRSFRLGHAAAPRQRGREPGAPPLRPPPRADTSFAPPHSCSTGYINHSLSIFRIRDFEPHTKVPEMLPRFFREEIKECR